MNEHEAKLLHMSVDSYSTMGLTPYDSDAVFRMVCRCVLRLRPYKCSVVLKSAQKFYDDRKSEDLRCLRDEIQLVR